jgi:hypothetical protein
VIFSVFTVKNRRPIPGSISDRLMAANRHTCCICCQPRHPAERHHINGDPSDNSWDNLAVLCRNCHGLVTLRGNLGTAYTPGEVLQYKRDWEKRCAEASADEIESPVEERHETKLIQGDSHEEYPFDMEEGDELVFSIDANDCLDAAICEEDDVEEWCEANLDEERGLPEGYWFRTDVREGEYAWVAPEDGRYVLLLVNWDDKPTEVSVDAAVWAAGL